MTAKIWHTVFSVIAIILAIVSLVFTFTGLPSNFDTEPLLAIAVIVLAVNGFFGLKAK